MYLCKYGYVCIRIYIIIYSHIHIYQATSLQIYIQIYIHTFLYTYMYIYIYSLTWLCIFTNSHITGDEFAKVGLGKMKDKTNIPSAEIEPLLKLASAGVCCTVLHCAALCCTVLQCGSLFCTYSCCSNLRRKMHKTEILKSQVWNHFVQYI